MYPNDLLTGRQMIFTDEQEITQDNVFYVLTQALIDHQIVRAEIISLFEYEAGMQPIFYRKKDVRPEINIKMCVNYAHQFTNFKLGFNYGAPYTYVQRGQNDIRQSDPEQDDERIARLNEMFYEQKKITKEQQVFRDCIICGVGYLCVLPKRYEDGGAAPFDVLHLDPWNTFIVYSNDAYKEPLMAVTYKVKRDGVRIVTAYTRDYIYVGDAWEYTEAVEDGMDRKEWRTNGFAVKPNVFGRIPVVEFLYSYSRQGAWEPAISMMDALSLAQSDRMNDLAQYVQSILWMNDCKVDKEQMAQLTNGGLIITKSTADGRDAKIAYVTAPLNQSETQALIDSIYNQMLEIVGVPGRESSTGGNTGQALILSNGWQQAETQAKSSLMIADEAETQVLDIALAIIKNTQSVEDDIKSLAMSDVLPHIGRNKTYELSSRVNCMAALINMGIDPEKAITVVDIFDDPQQVTIDSLPRINSLLGLAGDGSRLVDDTGEEVPPEEVDATLERLAENAWEGYGEPVGV